MKHGQFPGYEFVKPIGSGSFGEVWLARDRGGGLVAFKLLRIRPDLRESLDLFKQEFAILSELRHAHLARVFDFGVSADGDQYYFTQELCAGQNFLSAVQGKPISYFEKVLVQVLLALDYIHAMGIAHFDIKSENILVAVDERGSPHAKVLDFGVAVRLTSLPKLIGGTPLYMAPEIIVGSARLDHRVDLYALGMLCLRALTGRLPFDPTALGAISDWHIHGQIEEGIWRGKEVPGYLREIVEKLLRKNPDERFSNARVALGFLNAATGQKYRDAEGQLQDKIPAEGPLVGRDDILQDLCLQLRRSTVEATDQPHSHVVYLCGEQGLGKSRLLDEVRRTAEILELRVSHFSCDQPVATLPIPATMVGVDLPLLAHADREWRSRLHLDVILRMSEEKPICLLVDDYHHADGDTLAFVDALSAKLKDEHLSGRCPRIFVLVAMEEEKGDAHRLPKLDPSDVQQYIERVLGPIDRLASTAEVLHQYSGGLPLLMVEGLRFVAPHIFHGEPIAHLLPPPQIENLYRDRIDALSVEERRLLLIISLLFRPVRMTELSGIMGLSAAEVARLAEGCRRRGLLKGQRMAPDDPYQVSSQALALGLVSRLEPEMRKALHLQIALGLEKAGGALPAELGTHMAKGGDLAKGKSYYCMAGRELRAAGQLTNAAKYLLKAIPLAEKKSAEWFGLVEETCQLLIFTGEYREAASYLELIEEDTSSHYEELQGWLAFKMRRFEAARQSYLNALKALPGDHLRERILLKNSIANADLQEGKIHDAMVIFSETLEMEHALPPNDARTITNNNLGLALSLAGRIEEAITFFTERLRALQPDQQIQKIDILNGLGYALLQGSRFDEAIGYLSDACALTRDTGSYHSIFAILGNLTTASLKEARYAEALSVLAETVEMQKRFGSLRDVAFNLLRQGDLYLLLGMEEASQECLLKGMAIAEGLGDEGLCSWFSLFEGCREREFGDARKATTLFAEAAEGARRTGDGALLNWSLYEEAEGAFEEGMFDLCRERLDGVVPAGDRECEARRDLLAAKLLRALEPQQAMSEMFERLERVCLENHLREILWEVYSEWAVAEIAAGRDAGGMALAERGIGVLEGISKALPEEYRDRYLKQRARQRLLAMKKGPRLQAIDGLTAATCPSGEGAVDEATMELEGAKNRTSPRPPKGGGEIG